MSEFKYSPPSPLLKKEWLTTIPDGERDACSKEYDQWVKRWLGAFQDDEFTSIDLDPSKRWQAEAVVKAYEVAVSYHGRGLRNTIRVREDWNSAYDQARKLTVKVNKQAVIIYPEGA